MINPTKDADDLYSVKDESYFKKVVVAKYENLRNFNFLKEIYSLENDFIDQLKTDNKKYNRSISKFGINFIIFLNCFF